MKIFWGLYCIVVTVTKNITYIVRYFVAKMSANFYVYFYFSTSSQFTHKVQQHPKFSIDVINQAKPEQQKPSQANAFYVFVVYFSFSENKKLCIILLTLLVDIGTYIYS